MSNPRIYLVLSTFLPLVGGVENRTFTLARSLREKGYEAQVVTFRHQSSWLTNEIIDGVPVLRVAGVLLGRRERLPKPFKSLLYGLALLALAWTIWRHRQRYDVLQVCGFSLLVLPLTVICRLTGKPLIIVVIGMGIEKSPNGSASLRLLAGPLDAGASWLHVNGSGAVTGDLERLGKPMVWLISVLLQGMRVVVVVLSSRMKRYLAEHAVSVPEIQLIPNGVNLSRFSPAFLDTSVNQRTEVICVARMRYEKGIDVLLQAWRLIQQQLSSAARLIIAGDGQLQPQLEHLAKALGVAESVEFIGAQQDVPAVLGRGSIAVLPSRSEGMSNALLEAMACGLACVATRVSGSEDLLQHGVNGLLVEVEDYEGMAEALLILLRNPALVEKYRRAARETIEQHYSLEHSLESYMALYQKQCRSI